MPGVGMQELCCLFCCPPLPSRIAAKLAFLPPNPSTYHLVKQAAVCGKSSHSSSSNNSGPLDSGASCSERSERSDDKIHLIAPPRPTAPPKLTEDGLSKVTVSNGDTSTLIPISGSPLKEPCGHDISQNESNNHKNKGTTALGKMIRSKTLFFSSGGRGGSEGGASGAGRDPFPTLGIHLSQRAEWQYSGKELDRLEACTAVTARGHVIPCLMVRCGPPLPPSAAINSGGMEIFAENSADAPSMADMILGPGSSPFTSTKGPEVSLDPAKRSSPSSGSKSGSKRGTKSSPPLAKGENGGVVMKSSRCRTAYAPTQYTLLFSHGNAVDLGQMSSFYLGLGSRLGCDVMGYDYTGYGASQTLKQAAQAHQQATQPPHHGRCRPSEADVYVDAEAAWKALKIKFKVPHDRIILYGQSIGTVPTIHLAAKFDSTEPPAGVILHSPLTSGLRVAFPFVVPSSNNATTNNGAGGGGVIVSRGRRLKPTHTSSTGGDIAGQPNFESDFESPRGVLGCLDAFATMDKVRLIIRSPTLVIHGTDDEVIDHSHGRAIHANLPKPVDPLWVRGAGHNDIELHTEFLVRLKKFIRDELNPTL